MAPQCTALNVSDESRCEEEASSLNGLFCQYHSKQCQGMLKGRIDKISADFILALYKGYKRRNAHLDSLAKESPKYLADNVVPLANQTFKDITSEEVLRELRAHLSLRHALLDRVIRARKLHHSRFFSMTLDYGECKLDISLGTIGVLTIISRPSSLSRYFIQSEVHYPASATAARAAYG